MTNLSDTVKQAQAGDLAAFETLARQFQDMAVGYAHALVGDFHIAEDIAQESFFQTYRDLNKLEKPAAFPSWFRRIVFKHCDRVTRRSHVPTVSLDELVETVPGDDSPEDRLDDRDRNNLVEHVLYTLPEQERTTITLYYISDFSQKEVAAYLDVPITTVKARLRSARKKL